MTVYDSEIAFRLRGTRGNVNVTIINTEIHDCQKAIRAEDTLSNLKVYHSTFGDAIVTDFQIVAGDGSHTCILGVSATTFLWARNLRRSATAAIKRRPVQILLSTTTDLPSNPGDSPSGLRSSAKLHTSRKPKYTPLPVASFLLLTPPFSGAGRSIPGIHNLGRWETLLSRHECDSNLWDACDIITILARVCAVDINVQARPSDSRINTADLRFPE